MKRADPMHTSVCSVCYQGTWYAPTAIEISPAIPYRKAAFVTDPAQWEGGNRAHLHGKPAGTINLRVIDRGMLDPRFTRYYESGERIRVRFSYEDADGEPFELTGTVSKTMGWMPSYMLMLRSTSTGSSWLLSARDKVVAVKRGREYVKVAA